MSESGKHIIPVLSSSPPPLNDTPSFFDEDADDFGTFSSGVPGLVDPDSPKVANWSSGSSSNRQYHRSDTLPSSDPLTVDPGGFAQFEAVFPAVTDINGEELTPGSSNSDDENADTPSFRESPDGTNSRVTTEPPDLSEKSSVESLDFRNPNEGILPSQENGGSQRETTPEDFDHSTAPSLDLEHPAEDGDSDFGEFGSVTAATDTRLTYTLAREDSSETENNTATTFETAAASPKLNPSASGLADPTNSVDPVDPPLADPTNIGDPIDLPPLADPATNSIDPVDPAADGFSGFNEASPPTADATANDEFEADADFADFQNAGDCEQPSFRTPEGVGPPVGTLETHGAVSVPELPPQLDELDEEGDAADFADFAEASTAQPFSLPAPFSAENGGDSANNSRDPSETGDSEPSYAEGGISTIESLGASEPTSKSSQEEDSTSDRFANFDRETDSERPPPPPLPAADDFDDFSSFPPTSDSGKPAAAPEPDDEAADAAEFADFAGFSGAGAPGSAASDEPGHEPGPALAPAAPPEEDDFGEFADFSSAPPSLGVVGPGPSGAPQDQGGAASQGGDSFGDFSGATDLGAAEPPQPGPESVAKSVEQVFEICFPLKSVEDLAEVVVDLLSDVIGRDLRPATTTLKPVDESQKTKTKKPESIKELNVWKNLENLKKTNALSYQWTGSQNDKHFLSSLGVDARNILQAKKSSVPIFAASLTLLQPSKVGEKAEKAEKAVEETQHTQTPADKPPPEPENLPQVEFDWTGSGLINPLDANSLNLDFFAAEKKKAGNSSSRGAKKGLDNELLDLEMPSAPALPVSTPSQSKMASLLENLENLSTTPKRPPTHRNPNLSQEANNVLDGLPRLAFMQSSVLMFPVKSPTQQLSPQ